MHCSVVCPVSGFYCSFLAARLLWIFPGFMAMPCLSWIFEPRIHRSKLISINVVYFIVPANGTFLWKIFYFCLLLLTCSLWMSLLLQCIKPSSLQVLLTYSCSVTFFFSSNFFRNIFLLIFSVTTNNSFLSHSSSPRSFF